MWPAGQERPTASTLNAEAGRTVPNMVVVPVGADGRISIYQFAGRAEVIVDVLGWFATGEGFQGLVPGAGDGQPT